jgi:hypothetical protein
MRVVMFGRLYMFVTIGMVPAHLTMLTDNEATTNLLCQAIGSFVSANSANAPVGTSLC